MLQRMIDAIKDSTGNALRMTYLAAAAIFAHYGQMSGYSELQTLIDMITINGARALGLNDYGLEPGCLADLVVFDAPTEMDAIRLVAPRRLVAQLEEGPG